MNELELVQKELDALKRFLEFNMHKLSACYSNKECYKGARATDVFKEQLEVFTEHKGTVEKRIYIIDLVVSHVSKYVAREEVKKQLQGLDLIKGRIRQLVDGNIEGMQEQIKYDLSNPIFKGVGNMMGELSDKILNDDMGDTPKEVVEYYNEFAGKEVSLKQLATLIKKATLENEPIVQDFYKEFSIYPMSLSTYILQFGLVLGSEKLPNSYGSEVQDKFIKLATKEEDL